MNLRKKIFKNIQNIPIGIEVFIFGSTLYTENVNDVDLALVYDSRIINIPDVLEFRKTTKLTITQITGIECQIIAISSEENIELEFTKNIKCEKITNTSS